jgi:hypothetical protein
VIVIFHALGGIYAPNLMAGVTLPSSLVGEIFTPFFEILDKPD